MKGRARRYNIKRPQRGSRNVLRRSVETTAHPGPPDRSAGESALQRLADVSVVMSAFAAISSGHGRKADLRHRSPERQEMTRSGRIADHKITRLDELMPWRYAQQDLAQPDPTCFGRWGATDGHRRSQGPQGGVGRTLTSNRGLISKIRPSDGCKGDTVPSTVVRGYDLRKPGGHLGNVG